MPSGLTGWKPSLLCVQAHLRQTLNPAIWVLVTHLCEPDKPVSGQAQCPALGTSDCGSRGQPAVWQGGGSESGICINYSMGQGLRYTLGIEPGHYLIKSRHIKEVKDKYHMISLICGIWWTKWTDKQTHRYSEQTDSCQRGGCLRD